MILLYIQPRRLDMKKSAIGISSFPEIIRGGYNYIDKTRYVYYITRRGGHFSLYRPDGFGKTLFCSTLAAAYRGERDLFKGLRLERTDYPFEKHAVFFLEFSKLRNPRSIEDFQEKLSSMIAEQAEEQGIEVEQCGSPGMMLDNIFYDADCAMGLKSGLIIDDYDAPIASLVSGDHELARKIERVLQHIGAIVKSSSDHLRFFLLAGTSKYACQSIFSGMNHLYDISDDEYFSRAMGYTDEDLEEYFGEEIDRSWEGKGFGSRAEFIDAIKSYYGGYRFSDRNNETVCNPSSVDRFFDNGCEFRNYRELSPMDELAFRICREYMDGSLQKEPILLADTEILSFDISQLLDGKYIRYSIHALLFFTGFLTIVETMELCFEARVPNKEAREILERELVVSMERSQ